jgi:hypothetical protein
MSGVDTFPTDLERRTLGALADVLIPASERMPSATKANVPGKWLDRALRACPDLPGTLRPLLHTAAGREPGAEARRLAGEDPAGFEALVLAVTGAYYMNPKVRKLIGYAGQKANPPYPDEAEHFLADGILDPVIRRGPIGRLVPQDAGLDIVANET